MTSCFNETETIKNIFSHFEGLISENESMLLYNLAKNCTGNKGIIVEIGSWKGKSTICLAKGSKVANKVKIYAIDPHKDTLTHKANETPSTYEEFKKNLQAAEVDEIVNPICSTSQEAARIFDEPVELLFIDGDHEYGMVKLDFELWFPKLINGGIIALHDCNFPGLEKLICEDIFSSRHFKNIGFVDRVLFAQKTQANSLKDRLRNKLVFLIYKFAITYFKLTFPKPSKKFRMKILRILRIIK